MSETLRRSFVLLVISAACMAAVLAFFPAAGHDQLWFLLMARRWLDGAPLYGPEIFDSNPPSIVWISAIPVFCSELSHLATTFVAKAFVLAAAAGVATWSGSLLQRVWRRWSASEGPALFFAFVVLFLVVPARDLGQRDALAALFVLPYVLCAGGSLAKAELPLTPRMAAAALAAIGFCMKPQDALIAITLEVGLPALLWWRTQARPAAGRWLRRPELPLLIAGGAVYLLAIRAFAPLYFTRALPIVRSTYWAIGHLSVTALLWQAIELCLLATVTLVLLLRSRPVSPAVQVLVLAGGGGFLAYLLQGTGWYYQQLPAMDLFGVALALQLLELHHRHPAEGPPWLVAGTAAICVLAVSLTTYFSGFPFTPDRSFAITSPDPAFFRELAPGTPVAILTTSVDEAMMPVERFSLTWGQRTDNLWLLPAILDSEQPTPGLPPPQRLSAPTIARLDSIQHRWMVEDLNRWRPALVLVERCQDPAVQCQELEGRHDDLLAWFRRDPAFTSLWRQYVFLRRGGRFDAYLLQPRSRP